MAHVGQELALAAVGGFRAEMRFAQLVGQVFQSLALLLLAALAQGQRACGHQQKQQLGQRETDDLVVLLQHCLVLALQQSSHFRVGRKAQSLYVHPNGVERHQQGRQVFFIQRVGCHHLVRLRNQVVQVGHGGLVFGPVGDQLGRRVFAQQAQAAQKQVIAQGQVVGIRGAGADHAGL